MDPIQEIEVLDTILNYKVPIIPENTRFWMIRTQKGYFYNEFVSKKFVALAWNAFDQSTNYSEAARDSLKDDVLMTYPKIRRPSTVINKCQLFIHEIKPGDILVIPSKGSHYITFASAGDYYEDESKTEELEDAIIRRIDTNDIDVRDISCPYKKRRHITPLRTIKADEVSSSLYRAISNHHGISCLDEYANPILNHLYNCYSFREDVVLVYNIRKTTPIRPREYNGFLYGNIELLSAIASEDLLSMQTSLHSPGDSIFILRNALLLLKDNWQVFFGLMIVVGGGKAFGFEFHGLLDIIKSIQKMPTEDKLTSLELEEKQQANEMSKLTLMEKRLEVYEKIKSSGVDIETLTGPLEQLAKNASSMQSSPIELGEEYAKIPETEYYQQLQLDVIDDDDSESNDSE